MTDTENQKAKKTEPKETPAHGTEQRYRWRAEPCRCDECRAAHTLRQKGYRDRAKPKKPPERPKPPPHGTRARYGWKLGNCRCKDCRAANTKWQREYRDSKGSGQKRVRKQAIHGTRAKYVSGCRCKECTRSNRDYQREKARLYRASKEGLSDFDG